MASKKRVYRVFFHNQGRVFEVYARNVSQGGLWGFVEIEGLLFGEKSALVVDPSEESLQREFADVPRTFVPLHAVIRIDEVEKRGAARIHSVADAGKVTPLPTPIYSPGRTDK